MIDDHIQHIPSHLPSVPCRVECPVSPKSFISRSWLYIVFISSSFFLSISFFIIASSICIWMNMIKVMIGEKSSSLSQRWRQDTFSKVRPPLVPFLFWGNLETLVSVQSSWKRSQLSLERLQLPIWHQPITCVLLMLINHPDIGHCNNVLRMTLCWWIVFPDLCMNNPQICSVKEWKNITKDLGNLGIFEWSVETKAMCSLREIDNSPEFELLCYPELVVLSRTWADKGVRRPMYREPNVIIIITWLAFLWLW